MVLVATPIWGLSIRRRSSDVAADEKDLTQTLSELVRGGQVQLLGVTRQEILSGIREEAQFRRIRDHLPTSNWTLKTMKKRLASAIAADVRVWSVHPSIC